MIGLLFTSMNVGQVRNVFFPNNINVHESVSNWKHD